MLSKNSYHLHPVYCKWSFGNSNKKILTWSSVWLRACLTSSVFTTPYKNSGDFDTAWSNRPMTRALLKHMVRAPSCSSVNVHFILFVSSKCLMHTSQVLTMKYVENIITYPYISISHPLSVQDTPYQVSRADTGVWYRKGYVLSYPLHIVIKYKKTSSLIITG